MKTFSNYIVEETIFNEDVFSLLEASITKSEYGPGRQVVPRKKQLSSLSSAIGIEVDEKSIFTKTEPKDDAKEIQIGSGSGAEVYLELRKRILN